MPAQVSGNTSTQIFLPHAGKAFIIIFFIIIIHYFCPFSNMYKVKHSMT